MKKPHTANWYLFVACILLIMLSCGLMIATFVFQKLTSKTTQQLNSLAVQQAYEQANTSPDQFLEPKDSMQKQKNRYVVPIAYFPDGVTKKSYGMYVEEQSRGYHAGVDVEIPEQDIDKEIAVYAIADGQIKLVEQVEGNGGVIILQFQTDGLTYTASYSYLKKVSILVRPGDTVKKGQKLGILGNNRSAETAGERKHLQFIIHKDFEITYQSSVSSKKDLEMYVDPITFLANALPLTALQE